MAGLIPLALGLDLTAGLGVYQLHEADEMANSEIISVGLEVEPVKRTVKESAPSKRSSSRGPSPIKVVPYTVAEWKKALAEVKRDYTNRRFRQCSSRCHEIIVNLNHTRTVENAYIIFLHFYAASALEMQVRSLHHTSPFRSRMLHQARDHYRHASDLAKTEDDIMGRTRMLRRCRSSLSTSPSSSSLHSPSDSIASITSTVSTRTSSPSPSEPCLEGKGVEAPTVISKPIKPRKRVQFCEVQSVEPMIRPDSPTLGFDEWLGRSSPDLIDHDDPAFRHADEEPPPLNLDAEVTPEPSSKPVEASPESKETQMESVDEANQEEDDIFSQTRSIHRYRTILTDIRRQITIHLNAVEADIACFSSSNRKSYPPTSFAGEHDEARAMELRARIERLKAGGWPRRKFDAERYEALRDSAMADMLS